VGWRNTPRVQLKRQGGPTQLGSAQRRQNIHITILTKILPNDQEREERFRAVTGGENRMGKISACKQKNGGQSSLTIEEEKRKTLTKKKRGLKKNSKRPRGGGENWGWIILFWGGKGDQKQSRFE